MLYILIMAIRSFFNLVEILIVIDALSTFIMSPRSNPVTRAIGVIIDPILVPCYKLQQSIAPNLPIDFSPMIAIILIDIVKRMLISLVI